MRMPGGTWFRAVAPLYFPVAWFEVGGSLNDDQAQQLRTLNTAQYIHFGTYFEYLYLYINTWTKHTICEHTIAVPATENPCGGNTPKPLSIPF